MNTKEWFVDWFNTHYYHILYKKRDNKEAQDFIDAILKHLKDINVFTNQNYTLHALDLACGKGRHSLYLNNHGLKVTGIDLASESIKEASVNNSSTLNFVVQDMRNSMGENQYDFVFNLFTSFGYFNTDEEELLVLNNVFRALKPGGYFVFDFLNADKVKASTCNSESKTLEGIEFTYSKRIENNFVFKDIVIKDKNERFEFQEKVKLLDNKTMTSLLEKANFKIKERFGNYKLDNFDKDSDRLIIISQK